MIRYRDIDDSLELAFSRKTVPNTVGGSVVSSLLGSGKTGKELRSLAVFTLAQYLAKDIELSTTQDEKPEDWWSERATALIFWLRNNCGMHPDLTKAQMRNLLIKHFNPKAR